MKKAFLITVDTEGDNLWNYSNGDIVGTANASYLPRFQRLCEEYGFKPVWLTNYEMACSQEFMSFASDSVSRGSCEVGIHIHAWNNPPIYHLGRKYSGNPYLIEYPENVMREKFRSTFDLIKSQTGINTKTHRSGRWAMDERYFKILEEFNISSDCSFTPGISWRGVPGATVLDGSDYRTVPPHTHRIGKIIEVPVTVRYISHFHSDGSFKHRIKSIVTGSNVWLRPSLSGVRAMKRLIDVVRTEDDTDYLELMLHSSELMPGGSPYASTGNDIDDLYYRIRSIFDYAKNLGYEGETMEEYVSRKQKGNL